MLWAAPDSGRQSTRAVSAELWRRRRWPVVAAAASTGIGLGLRPARWFAVRQPCRAAAANRPTLFLFPALLRISSRTYAAVLAG
jgi:hypothetical protein